MSSLGRVLCSVLYIALLVIPGLVYAADAKDNLHKITLSIKNLQGDFTQFEYDERGRPLRVLQGKFKMTNKLQLWWQVAPPYAQTVISNGTHTMIYDDDLQQLIVRALDTENLPPFFFMASNPQLLDQMTIDQPDPEDPTFFLSDSNTDIFVRFNRRLPVEISWENELNQKIMINFSRVTKNRRLAKKIFDFKPPPGTSIITD